MLPTIVRVSADAGVPADGTRHAEAILDDRADRATRRARHAVLVVDDFEDVCELYVALLGGEGYGAAGVGDGLAALEAVAARAPDLIVMDLGMPGLDGAEVTRILKAELATAHILIIVVTGHATAWHLARARDAGADLVLTKPCLPGELVAAVDGLLKV